MKLIIFYFLFFVFLPGLIFAQHKTKKEYFFSGKLKSEIIYSDSLRDGDAKFYYENGNPKLELTYINGRVEGTVKAYYKNGNVKEIYTITDGKRDGQTIVYDSSGNYLKTLAYTNGKLDIEKPTIEAKDNKSDSLLAKKIEKLKSSKQPAVPPKLSDEHMKGDLVYFPKPDVKPEPIGGMKSIYSKLVYPMGAFKKDIEGTVELQVFVNEDGYVDDTKVIKGIGYGCDASAQKAVKYTKFTPGKLKGEIVKSQIKLSIVFKKSN